MNTSSTWTDDIIGVNFSVKCQHFWFAVVQEKHEMPDDTKVNLNVFD